MENQDVRTNLLGVIDSFFVDMEWEYLTISNRCETIVDSFILEEKIKFGNEMIELGREIMHMQSQN